MVFLRHRLMGLGTAKTRLKEKPKAREKRVMKTQRQQARRHFFQALILSPWLHIMDGMSMSMLAPKFTMAKVTTRT